MMGNWQDARTMRPAEYKAFLGALGLNNTTAAAWLGIARRSSIRYGLGGAVIPVSTVLLLRACIAKNIKPRLPSKG
jgi:uncharacterized membrane protein YqhA